MTLKGAVGSHYANRQAMFAGSASSRRLVASFDYSRLREYRFFAYGLLIALNLIVFGISAGTLGARRWIPLGPFQFQPSEFGKLLLIVALAGFSPAAVATARSQYDRTDHVAGAGRRDDRDRASRTSAPGSST